MKHSLTTAVLFLFGALDPASGPAAPADPKASKPYNVAVSAPAPRLGVPAPLTVAVVPAPPYFIKARTPFELRLNASQGMSIKKRTFDGSDWVDQHTATKTVATELVCGSATEQTLTGDLSFVLCDATTCTRITESIHATVCTDAK